MPEIVKKELSEYSSLMQKLLFARGIETAKQAYEFLNPDYERDINDPFLILNMERAVLRILDAIKNKEKILIYGDYDCDGIPGSVVLHDFFKKIKYENFENYIPHRHDEGYGLNIPAIESFAKRDVRVLITVDCGITDFAEVSRAKELGIDVVVTDHHVVESGRLPDAYAILNSKQCDDKYPDDMLCGAGVAWKLVQAMLQKGKELKMQSVVDVKSGWDKWLLDMAGLSTIADMVPLRRENRAIAYFGLKVLQKSPRLGLLGLLQKTKINQEYLTEDDVGFMIAPRINAASRMDIPSRAFELLATESDVVAGELSEHLHRINDDRKRVVANILKEVKKNLSKREVGNVVVIGNPKWRVGVLGIVASNIVDEYGKPAFVWGRAGGGEIKGSCRSDGNIDLVELMRGAKKDTFTNMGGHKFSGGFAVSNENVHLLEEELSAVFDKISHGGVVSTEVEVDAKLTIDDVNWSVYGDIEKLAPFGVGNRKPTFLFDGVEVAGVSHFGKESNHLKLSFKNSSGKPITAIAFFKTEDMFAVPIEKGSRINLVAVIEKSMFRNFPELRLRIVDIS